MNLIHRTGPTVTSQSFILGGSQYPSQPHTSCSQSEIIGMAVITVCDANITELRRSYLPGFSW